MTTDTNNDVTVAFWDCHKDRERLSHTTIDEAVTEWADAIDFKPLPEMVVVYGWARMELPSAESIASDVLDFLVERIDEDFGDPEDTTEPTPEMRAAAVQFGQRFRDAYPTWMCEQTTERTVRVAEYYTPLPPESPKSLP